MPYDEKWQSGAHLRRGFRNYHRKMSPIHKRALLSLEVAEPYPIGTYVISAPGKLQPREHTPEERAEVVAVGKIIRHEVVTLMRTSKIYEPPKVHKYRIRWTYDNGWTAKTWVQHKLLTKISKKAYLKFFKKHKIKKLKPKGK